MNKFWRVYNSVANVGELYIYGEIASEKWDDTDTTAQSFKSDLEALGDIHTLNLYINSPGGSVFQGQAIYSILKRHKAKKNVHIDGLAASIASVIAMAGDTIYMPSNAMLMVHNPTTFAVGNAEQFRKEADNLDRIRESMIESYLAKTGDKLNRFKLIQMLDAETWLSARECYEYGLCDIVEEGKQVAAMITSDLYSKYRNTPRKIIQAEKTRNTLSVEERKKIIIESITSSIKITKDLAEIEKQMKNLERLMIKL